ncbi:hypothetical protein FRC11_005804, partial [Ceratobasidium sp. 423]
MPPVSNNHWGQAARSDASLSEVDQHALFVEYELAGLQAMQKLSRLATDAPKPSPTNPGVLIDINTLNYALRMIQGQSTIGHLMNPPAISGCVRLMASATNQSTGVAS